jgi:2-oxoglutarate dehydrogenase complex dehydrogenase (E1) component-like enzyme
MRTSIDARANVDLIEENYRRWQQNPQSVDSGWSAFFEGFELGNLPQRDGATVAEAEAREAALQTRASFTHIARSGTPLRASIRWQRRDHKIRC